MNPTGLKYKQRSTDFMYNDFLYDPKLDWIPLYTHPVKELTDEEIMDEWWHLTANGWEVEPNSLMQFAKAILRKAQEK